MSAASTTPVPSGLVRISRSPTAEARESERQLASRELAGDREADLELAPRRGVAADERDAERVERRAHAGEHLGERSAARAASGSVTHASACRGRPPFA